MGEIKMRKYDVEITEVEDEYITAVYTLVDTICSKDPRCLNLSAQLLKASTGVSKAELEKELLALKADLVNAYTQRVERGGLI
jgi:hypothetical protein